MANKFKRSSLRTITVNNIEYRWAAVENNSVYKDVRFKVWKDKVIIFDKVYDNGTSITPQFVKEIIESI